MHYSNKNNSLMVLGIPVFIFFGISVIFVSVYAQDNIYNKIYGSVYSTPPLTLFSTYNNLDSLAYAYCKIDLTGKNNKTKSMLVYASHPDSCFNPKIYFDNEDILVSSILLSSFIAIISITFWAMYIDLQNRDYRKIILGCYMLNCLLAFVILYILRYQPYISNYFWEPKITSGSMTSLNNTNIVDTCHFNYTNNFKKCYCELINTPHLSFLNVTKEGPCKMVPNGYSFGLIIFGLSTMTTVVLYYLSHNQPEYIIEDEPLFFERQENVVNS